ncbi:hypothetical protein [Methanosphaerula palustris]|uniref:hypothetical protein n=1 Tax=Methanosphaerula palustris TaxID=475088 RepID=UPI001305428C|nr:hypothetical protein [Methanosphaerula palustris]
MDNSRHLRPPVLDAFSIRFVKTCSSCDGSAMTIGSGSTTAEPPTAWIRSSKAGEPCGW